jgi:hypothetical protein
MLQESFAMVLAAKLLLLDVSNQSLSDPRNQFYLINIQPWAI